MQADRRMNRICVHSGFSVTIPVPYQATPWFRLNFSYDTNKSRISKVSVGFPRRWTDHVTGNSCNCPGVALSECHAGQTEARCVGRRGQLHLAHAASRSQGTRELLMPFVSVAGEWRDSDSADKGITCGGILLGGRARGWQEGGCMVEAFNRWHFYWTECLVDLPACLSCL